MRELGVFFLLVLAGEIVRRLGRLWGVDSMPRLLPLLPAALLSPLSAWLPVAYARHAVFAFVFASLCWHLVPLVLHLDRDSNLRSRRLAALFAVPLAALAVQHVHSPPFDDESMRLAAVVSFAGDLDFDLADEYRGEEWLEFRDSSPSYYVDFARKVRTRLLQSPTAFYPYHAVGFPILLAPGYIAGRFISPRAARLGAAAPLYLAAVLLVGLFAVVLHEQGMPVPAARRMSLLLGTSAPMLFFGIHLWPEIIAALAAIWIFHALGRPNLPGLGLAAVGAAAGALPLFHFRYAFLSLPLVLLAFWRLRERFSGWIPLILGLALPGCGVAFNLAIRAHPETWDVLTRIGYEFPQNLNLPDFSLIRLMDLDMVIARIVMPPAGFLAYLPFLLVCRRRGFPLRTAALLAASGPILILLTYALGSGPLARFWVPVIPLVALATWGPGEPGRAAYALGTFGAVKGLMLCCLPVLCHDALVATHAVDMLTRMGWLGAWSGRALLFLAG